MSPPDPIDDTLRNHFGFELTDELQRRALRREASEIDRLRQVLELISHDGCLASALGAHFGEALATPCGHCSWCSSVDSSGWSHKVA